MFNSSQHPYANNQDCHPEPNQLQANYNGINQNFPNELYASISQGFNSMTNRWHQNESPSMPMKQEIRDLYGTQVTKDFNSDCFQLQGHQKWTSSLFGRLPSNTYASSWSQQSHQQEQDQPQDQPQLHTHYSQQKHPQWNSKLNKSLPLNNDPTSTPLSSISSSSMTSSSNRGEISVPSFNDENIISSEDLFKSTKLDRPDLIGLPSSTGLHNALKDHRSKPSRDSSESNPSSSPRISSPKTQAIYSSEIDSDSLGSELHFSKANLALATVPGMDFNPESRVFSQDELRPQPIIRKRKKHFVSDENKDDKYWSRRIKNNIAARRSREARRLKENQIALRAAFLESENKNLRQKFQVALHDNFEIEKEVSDLTDQLKKFET
ncbi:hypothetical protein TCAL_03320 [Tigriopus californicus]|uniref:BZIP domain-containing protein n=1 Tax=Tigriopus californicus TaxID=6832 RepID=A0A553NQ47_TIGCA|nr:thyrotroph embryonic factor-like [Tigriopus californicus]TRY67529.1 hypothetical protein TCAL_03320 [Tigriopus californicus]|eukprot:TCALIF_03320-PA protein Name:"Similar to TEF Transcription factor VBP (Gallus gallus)" AED:0.01 eAED:0.01 QI:356/1/0.5/1/1/1/2/0/379